MKLHFLGAAHEVTGSCTLLEVAGRSYLVDCGMEQGADIFENVPIPVTGEHMTIRVFASGYGKADSEIATYTFEVSHE